MREYTDNRYEEDDDGKKGIAIIFAVIVITALIFVFRAGSSGASASPDDVVSVPISVSNYYAEVIEAAFPECEYECAGWTSEGLLYLIIPDNILNIEESVEALMEHKQKAVYMISLPPDARETDFSLIEGYSVEYTKSMPEYDRYDNVHMRWSSRQFYKCGLMTVNTSTGKPGCPYVSVKLPPEASPDYPGPVHAGPPAIGTDMD